MQPVFYPADESMSPIDSQSLPPSRSPTESAKKTLKEFTQHGGGSLMSAASPRMPFLRGVFGELILGNLHGNARRHATAHGLATKAGCY